MNEGTRGIWGASVSEMPLSGFLFLLSYHSLSFRQVKAKRSKLRQT